MSPPCGGHDQGPRERVNRVLNCHFEQVRDVSLGYQDYPLESASRTGSNNKSTPHTPHRCTGIARNYPGPGPALSRFRTALFTFAPFYGSLCYEEKQNKTTLAPRIPWKDKRPECIVLLPHINFLINFCSVRSCCLLYTSPSPRD